MVTIHDVAQKAGVSISTVSAVMNDTKYVSPKLRLKVLKAIKELDYRPNRVAQALHRKKTRTIAYLTPDITNVNFANVLKGIMRVANERDYTVIVLDTEGNRDQASRYFRNLVDLRVDGALINLTWDIACDSNLAIAKTGNKMQVVGVSGARLLQDIDCFIWDEKEAGRQLARYLLRLGHKQLLFLAPSPSEAANQRFGGIKQAFDEQGIEFSNKAWLPLDGYGEKSGYTGTFYAIGCAWDFSAIICFNDKITTGVMAALDKQGLKVPDDVALTTFGNSHIGLSSTPITSMVFNDRKLGFEATQHLIDQIEGIHISPPAQHLRQLKLSVQSSSIAYR